MLYLNDEQFERLLMPLDQGRVSSRTVQGRSLSYVEASDIKRWLIRVFGFGGFDVEVTEVVLAFEHQVESSKGKSLWQVGYRVTTRLTVTTATPDVGRGSATYKEAAVGFASLPDRGEAHDMAVKTAESDALKRCAIYLGTQFGLSLYFGTQDDVVRRTLADNRGTATAAIDPQADPAPIPEVSTPQEAAQSPEPVQTLNETDRAVDVLDTAGVLAPAEAPQEGAYGTWMDSLRAAALQTDNAQRVQQVTALQKIAVDRFPEGFLDSLVTVKGHQMTHRTLVANCAAGMYLGGS